MTTTTTERRYYSQEDAEFAAVLSDPTSKNFRPRNHVFYSEREAEQDAYFWFQQGQRVAMERQLQNRMKQ